MKSFIIILCIVSVISRTTWDKLNNYKFEDYVKEFNKIYGENEYQERRAVFQRRLSQIIAHNSNPTHSWKQGVNHLTDLYDSEISKMMGYKRTPGIKPTAISKSTNNKKITYPRTIDWRTSGIISPVKDQGHCGSCWAFASAESIESYWALHKGYLVTLSEQQIVDCVANPRHCGGTGGCNGGTAELAFETLKSTGIASEWTYPYVSHSGAGSKCHFDATSTPAEANVTGFVKLDGNSYHSVMEALILQGPLAINVDASTWHSYESGVFDGCNQTNPDVNHVVQLVGYGTDEVHGDYWLIRNSWRPTYGEGGYIRVRRTNNEDARCGTDLTPQDGVTCDGDPPTARVCGTCGVIYDASYPIVV